MAITELRLVLTVDDPDRATAIFRDALGLKRNVRLQGPEGIQLTLFSPLGE